MKLSTLGNNLAQTLVLAGMVAGCQNAVLAATFGTPTVFATGAPVGGTQPDSVTYGNNSLWVEYGNGAPATNYTGSGTIVQYSMTGAVQNSYTIDGSVDGLKYNPNTGLVWALQNQDANSQLSIINPATKAVTSYTYGGLYNTTTGRGFDDVAFIGNNVYMSLSNPALASDPVLVKLDNSTPSSPVTQTSILNLGSLLLTDPDSLKSTPTGGLVETGEGDHALTFINNPGQASQTATSLHLVAAAGTSIGRPDDSSFASATSGTFYLTDTGANSVISISATGLTSTSLFVNVGNEFGSVDTTTGIVTPIITGTSLHGLEFVPSAATPEPATYGISLLGFAVAGFAALRKRTAK